MAQGRVNVYLIGFMGAGKSSVGKPLARLMKRRFVDSDRAIEKKAGATVAAIFSQKGEPAFRALERKTVAALAKKKNLVVALGGGALLDPRSRKAASSGTVVLLSCGEAELWRRVQRQAGKRPLLAGGRPALRALLKKRRAHYRSVADLVVAAGAKTPLQIARTLARRLS
jgi:shikimate kinase